MVTEIVADSSAIVALVIPEENSKWARKKIGEYENIHILEFSYYEIANAIKSKTPNNFTSKEAEIAFNTALNIMNQFGIHSFGEVIVDAMTHALEFNLAVYDAAFLVLAEKLGCPLLTLDMKFVKKLEKTKYQSSIIAPYL